ncbi:MAG: hypothetical protein Aurels2KO_56250 [Aureliella sp.]
MPKTVFVKFRANGFWAYDVASSIYANFLVSAAEKLDNDCIAESIHHWRVNAVVSDYGFYLDDSWSPEQINVVHELCGQASDSIRKSGDFDAETVGSWTQIDGGTICTRGHNEIPAEPIARLGDAIASLLTGQLPPAPENHWWFYGLDAETGIVKMGQPKTDG